MAKDAHSKQELAPNRNQENNRFLTKWWVFDSTGVSLKPRLQKPYRTFDTGLMPNGA